MKMVRAAVLAATAVTAAALPALAAAPAADSKFLKDAAAGGMAEVELGRLATEKATRSEVKEFGKMMVDDHSKANAELKSLAEKKGVTLPTAPKPEHKALEARLRKLSGAAFDDAYMSAMLRDHEKDVREFERESKSGGDADVKSWAGKTLPTLRHHLEAAKERAPKHSAAHTGK
jgi:putative membrane protein